MDASLQRLCRLDEVPDGGARGLLRQGNADRLFLVRRGDEVFAWLDDCPHEHRPLAWKRHHYLSVDGQHIVCHAHSAHFDIRSGLCFAGPCTGEHLVKVPLSRHDGDLFAPAVLPTPFD